MSTLDTGHSAYYSRAVHSFILTVVAAPCMRQREAFQQGLCRSGSSHMDCSMLRSEEMDDRYIMRSRILLPAMMGIGVLLCMCRVPLSSPPTFAGQRMRDSSAPDKVGQTTAPGSANTNYDSTAMMPSLAAVGGMLLLQQQEERREACPGESCEINPVPFLKLQTM